jgi:hypothetical protein
VLQGLRTSVQSYSPKKFIEILDKAVTDTQRKDYPLETCVVAGRLCCAGCEPKVIADPVKYLAAIDQTWQAKEGKFKPAPDSANHRGHDHGGE